MRIFLGYGGIGLGARYGSAELNTKAPLKEQKILISSSTVPDMPSFLS